MLIGYDRRVRLSDGGMFIFIGIIFNVVFFKEFFESEGKIVLVGVFRFVWRDIRLVWNLVFYGGDFE